MAYFSNASAYASEIVLSPYSSSLFHLSTSYVCILTASSALYGRRLRHSTVSCAAPLSSTFNFGSFTLTFPSALSPVSVMRGIRLRFALIAVNTENAEAYALWLEWWKNFIYQA